MPVKGLTKNFNFFKKNTLDDDNFFFCRDRFRTVVNVLGDAIGAGIVAHLSRDELREADEANKLGDDQELLEKYRPKDPDMVVSGL